MLAEIVKITVPNWVCVFGCTTLGLAGIICFVLCFIRLLTGTDPTGLTKNIVVPNSKTMPGVSSPSSPRQLLSYEEVVDAYSGGIDRCLCTGPYSVLLNPKTATCFICNDKGTIQGRQCSCKLAKYWREKC